MRLVTFSGERRRRQRSAPSTATRVVDLGFDGDMVAFVAGGDASLATAAARRSSPTARRRMPLASVRLLAPLVPAGHPQLGPELLGPPGREAGGRPEGAGVLPQGAARGHRPGRAGAPRPDRDEEARLRGRARRRDRQAGPPHPGRARARPRVRLHGRERHHGARPPGRAASRRAASSTRSAPARTSTRRRRSAPGS